MKISDAYPSRYLKASDLEGKNVPATIRSVVMENVDMSGDRQPVMFFREFAKAMVLNKTNSKMIAKLYGDETKEWAGKPIVLFEAMVDFKGDTVPAIRIRAPQNNEAPPPPERDPWERDDSIPNQYDPKPLRPEEKMNLPKPSIVTEAEAMARGGIQSFRSWRDKLTEQEYNILKPELARITQLAQEKGRMQHDTVLHSTRKEADPGSG